MRGGFTRANKKFHGGVRKQIQLHRGSAGKGVGLRLAAGVGLSAPSGNMVLAHAAMPSFDSTGDQVGVKAKSHLLRTTGSEQKRHKPSFDEVRNFSILLF